MTKRKINWITLILTLPSFILVFVFGYLCFKWGIEPWKATVLGITLEIAFLWAVICGDIKKFMLDNFKKGRK